MMIDLKINPLSTFLKYLGNLDIYSHNVEVMKIVSFPNHREYEVTFCLLKERLILTAKCTALNSVATEWSIQSQNASVSAIYSDRLWFTSGKQINKDEMAAFAALISQYILYSQIGGVLK